MDYGFVACEEGSGDNKCDRCVRSRCINCDKMLCYKHIYICNSCGEGYYCIYCTTNIGELIKEFRRCKECQEISESIES